jgi:hypothetical protein
VPLLAASSGFGLLNRFDYANYRNRRGKQGRLASLAAAIIF